MLSFLSARHRLVVAALAISAATAEASSPKFFTSATQADFLKGDAENLSVDGRGRLVLGPATDLVYETPSPFLWTLVPGPDGSLFIGTGNDGRVYRVDSSGRGALFFDATELEIHAIAPAPNGGLYVGSSPDGRIYKVDRNGTATTFFDPEEKYIWALATDSRGNVYAGTGEKGVVYKIDANGNGAPFYQTKATHATALAVDSNNRLLVGTESPGRVFRLDDQGRGFLLLDTPYQEIRTLRFDDKDVLYVAAVNGRGATGLAPSVPVDGSTGGVSGDLSRPPVPTVTVTTEITAVAVTDGSGTNRVDARSEKGAVYRIAPDGLWDQLWESREDSPYHLAFDADNRLIVATGPKGKILRLEGDPLRPMLLARASAQQVTALHKDARGNLYYATANPGKLFRLSSNRAPKGTYESEVRDARMVATWGALTWRGSVPSGSKVEISTRSGNSETPDDTWSQWSDAYTTSGTAITSPKARYLQWRLVLTGNGEGPALTSVSAAYLQRNLRPEVRTITVHQPGIVFQKPFSNGDPDLAGFDNQTTPDRRLTQAAQNAASGGGATLGRRTYQKGLQTLIWRAEDGNDDDLSYDVWYRREGDPTWKPLRREVAEPIFVWDTSTVPNGTYFVRVVASDAPSNSTDTALSGDLESESFDIDNTPPSISVGTVRADTDATAIAFDVNDDYSPVHKVEYSLDGQMWRTTFPTDGIADSRAEHYQLTVEGTLGPKGVTLRATDAMNNVSTAQVNTPAPR